MDPVTLSLFSIGTSAAGAGVSAYGALQQGYAKSAMYNYQSGVARLNADIQRQNAAYAKQAGEGEALKSGLASRHQQGRIRAARAASNLAVDVGSNADVQEGQALIGRTDLQSIRAKAARTAYGHEVEAWQSERQSDLYSMAATNEKKAGKIAALSSLMSGASSVSSKWSVHKTTFG